MGGNEREKTEFWRKRESEREGMTTDRDRGRGRMAEAGKTFQVALEQPGTDGTGGARCEMRPS